MALCRWMRRRRCTCCCVCKYVTLFIIVSVSIAMFRLYKMVTCDTMESKNLIKDLVCIINPHLPNGLSHHYHLDESTFNFRGIRSIFSILFYFL